MRHYSGLHTFSYFASALFTPWCVPVMLNFLFVVFPATICTRSDGCSIIRGFLLMPRWLQGQDLAKRSGRTMWTGAVFCSPEQKPWLSGLSVCRDRVAGTCEGWQRGPFWERGETSQPRESLGKKRATHRQDSQIMNHYTLVNVPIFSISESPCPSHQMVHCRAFLIRFYRSFSSVTRFPGCLSSPLPKSASGFMLKTYKSQTVQRI